MRSDTRMVAELFDQAANRLNKAAEDMRRLRDRITDDDLSAASEAVNMLDDLVRIRDSTVQAAEKLIPIPEGERADRKLETQLLFRLTGLRNAVREQQPSPE